jgi:Antitoxin Phd_YefM, type II toxin-antitoxin system
LRTVGLLEANQKFSEIVERAAEGERIGITRRGKAKCFTDSETSPFESSFCQLSFLPIVIPSEARNLLSPDKRKCKRSLPVSYSYCFLTSAGTLGSAGKSCEYPLNMATVFSARFVPSCTAILCSFSGE